jgi:hypothetical protein
MADCCGSVSGGTINKVTGNLDLSDKIGMIRCRLSNKTRSNYRVEPGLYALGSPGKSASVFVTANYRYSFDILRSALNGVDSYILVLDTKGINVWCAAGKGTFGTDELVHQIEATRLSEVVEQKRLIVPQLGAVGIAAHEVKERTGFAVRYGPVDARDLPDYIAGKMKATPEMRRVRFGMWDRFILTPMECVPALKILAPVALLLFVMAGLAPTGILFAPALEFFAFAGTALAASVLTGTIMGPLFLPIVPFRSFALKGAVLGLLYPLVLALWFPSGFAANPFLYSVSCVAAPTLSSFLLLQFTGTSTITGMSGVKKELRIGMPIYRSAAVLCGILLALAFLHHWMVI